MGQPLSNIADVAVQVGVAGSSPPQFDVGLIVGTSTIISASTRTVEYASTTDMKTGGWTGTEPEYLAAEAYFAQSPTPEKVVVGVQDTANSETLVAAVTACRTSNGDWYGVYPCDSVAADIEALAQYIEGLKGSSVFFYDTQDSAVAAGTAGNVMATLQTSAYKQTLGIYTTTVNYAGAAMMGVAMGHNTGLANSAFTLDYKSLAGITPETLTTTEYNTIVGYNGNVYTTFGSSLYLLSKGTMASGDPFDRILNENQLVADIQTEIIGLLTGTQTKIPYTDNGVNQLRNAVGQACESAVTRGVLAPGVWTNTAVLNLATGTMLGRGYVVLAETVASQSAANISARIAPPIYACVKFAGAIETSTIGVIVNL